MIGSITYKQQGLTLLELLIALSIFAVVSVMAYSGLQSIIIADERMHMPDDSRGIFEVLQDNKVITEKTAERMKLMVGFRNILVHMYEQIDVDIVYANYQKNLGDFDVFAKEIGAYIS